MASDKLVGDNPFEATDVAFCNQFISTFCAASTHVVVMEPIANRWCITSTSSRTEIDLIRTTILKRVRRAANQVQCGRIRHAGDYCYRMARRTLKGKSRSNDALHSPDATRAHSTSSSRFRYFHCLSVRFARGYSTPSNNLCGAHQQA